MTLNNKSTHFIGIFIIALAGIAYQVLLTRIFSVTLFYHFAFAGISLAMLGLTIGAERVYLNKERFSLQFLEKEWAKAALGFSISSVGLVLWFLYCPLIFSNGWVILVLISSLILFIVPFIYSGICITLVLTKSPAPIGKLYAADLLGAALGAMGIVGLLFLLDPVSIILGLASLTAFSAWLMLWHSSYELARLSKATALALMLACFIQGGLYLTDSPHLRVIWAKSHKQENILFERWNAFSRVRVIPHAMNVSPEDAKKPLGWGFGHEPTVQIDQRYLDIDADAGTVITHFDGNLEPLSFLADDIINIGYYIRPIKQVAVIGVGGGRDILSALYFGVKHVTGIELNPSIFEVLDKRFADFSGHLGERPDVSLVNAEARSWLNQAQYHRSFDLVQISLIDTWAATAVGGLTLSENKLYTVEAWKEFLESLNSQGVLVVSRWFDPQAHKGEFYRLLSLASESLKQEGVPPAEIKQHILAFNVGKIITIAISSNGFSDTEIKHINEVAKEKGFTIMMSPNYSWDEISQHIVSGGADAAFYNSLPLDVAAPTDDRPFFFYMMRIKNLLLGKAVEGVASGWSNNLAVGIVCFLFLTTFVCVLLFIIQPLAALSKHLPVKEILPYMSYFAGIGLGFMLIEISQMQRLIIFLGHPVYGLSVVLFTLLLFGGLGSFTVAAERDKKLYIRPLLLCLVLLATGLATPLVTEQLSTYNTFVRILASIALLAPAGLCMGMMFPVGMIISRHYSDLQPWFWGINGATSVFASILGMVVSIQYGITAAYWTGVVCYVLSTLLVLQNVKVAAAT